MYHHNMKAQRGAYSKIELFMQKRMDDLMQNKDKRN